MTRFALTMVVLATLGCRVDPDGDGDADADMELDADDDADDGADRVQACPADTDAGVPAACLQSATCCTGPDGAAMCCVAPRTECEPGVGCREPCNEESEERCAEVGDGGAAWCSPEGDGIIRCWSATPCWSLLLEPCEAGACQDEGGEPVCG